MRQDLAHDQKGRDMDSPAPIDTSAIVRRLAAAREMFPAVPDIGEYELLLEDVDALLAEALRVRDAARGHVPASQRAAAVRLSELLSEDGDWLVDPEGAQFHQDIDTLVRAAGVDRVHTDVPDACDVGADPTINHGDHRWPCGDTTALHARRIAARIEAPRADLLVSIEHVLARHGLGDVADDLASDLHHAAFATHSDATVQVQTLRDAAARAYEEWPGGTGHEGLGVQWVEEWLSHRADHIEAETGPADEPRR